MGTTPTHYTQEQKLFFSKYQVQVLLEAPALPSEKEGAWEGSL